MHGTRRSRAALAAALVLAACGSENGTPIVGTHPAQVRVIWTESPQTRARISWTTAQLGSENRVFLDEISRDGKLERYAMRIASQKDGRYTGGIDAHYHHAAIEGLKPATKYWFVVATDEQQSREFWFETAPDDDRPVTFVQGGDSRSGRAARRAMNAQIARIAADDPAVLCFAHGGDYVYHGHEMNLWHEWMSDHESIVTPDGRLLPIIPARGNHEAVGPQFDEVFGWPGGGIGKNWFATELSPEVLLVTLNTEVPHGGPQTEFLRRTVAANRGKRWQLAQYHRPMFPAVKAPSRAVPHWQPVFDEARFDVVCECDGHTLRRTVPILGSTEDPDGVVYLGEGGLGVRQRTPEVDRWYLAQGGFATSAHHVWKLTMTAHTIDCAAIGIGGVVHHSFHRAARDRTHR